MDPLPTHQLSSGIDVDALAEALGLVKHGSHWDDPANGNMIVLEDEVIARAMAEGINVSNEPLPVIDLDSIESFIYGGRLKRLLI